MSEDQKRRKILASIAAAGLVTVAAPVTGDPAPRVGIEHWGRGIEVSCNALDGHAQHADDAEMEDIEAHLMSGICDADTKNEESKTKEQKKKQESEAKQKRGATGFDAAEHETNRLDAAELIERLGDE